MTTVGTPGLRWITTGDETDYWPVFSPDGKAVLFTRGPDTGAVLMIVSLETGETRPFLAEAMPNVDQTRPDWSRADHHRVAFAGTGGIWLVEADGKSPKLLPNTENMIYPSWYPDGNAMAVMQTNGARNQPCTVKIGLDGATLGPLSPPGLYTGMPSVNQAEADLVVYPGQPAVGVYNQDNNQLWLTANSGVTATEIEAAQGRAPWWSPDGRLIAFESSRSTDGYALYVATPDASIVLRLTDPAIQANHAKWSHDMKRIVFAAFPEPGSARKIAVLDVGEVPQFRCLAA
jgi:TolB protein